VLACAALLAFGPAANAQQNFQSLKDIRERGIVMQNWESSCAAATLATVLTYAYYDPVSEQQAALAMLKHTEAAKVRAEGGFSMLDMKRFAAERGYEANGYQYLSLDELRSFHAPIVLLETKGYRHYVVFNGVVGDEVLLADPAFGHRRMSTAEFSGVWLDGLAFIVEGRKRQ
jgi:predicted double-glycine peptidase